VFEPFSQIDNRFDREAGGTGLGLALVRGLARLHGGRVWLTTEPGAGLKAYIYLPATSAGASVQSKARKIGQQPASALRSAKEQ
jgi:signal transduction histidine kinase